MGRHPTDVLCEVAGRSAPMVLVIYIVPWLVLLGGGTLLIIGLLNFHAARACTSWPQVPGIVTSITVETSEHPILAVICRTDPTMYHAHLTYVYRVGEAEHTGTRVRFGEMSTNTSGRARHILEEYEHGQRVPVHYHPKSPGKSVLEPGTQLQTYIFPVAGTLLTLLGLAMVIGLPIAARKAAELRY